MRPAPHAAARGPGPPGLSCHRAGRPRGGPPGPKTIAAPARPRSPQEAHVASWRPGAWHEAPIVHLPPSLGLLHLVRGKPPRSPPGRSQGAPGHLSQTVGSRRGAGPGLLFGALQPARQERGPLSQGNLPHSCVAVFSREMGDGTGHSRDSAAPMCPRLTAALDPSHAAF